MMRKHHKILLMTAVGCCVLAAAVLLAYYNTTPQKAAHQRQPATVATLTDVPQKATQAFLRSGHLTRGSSRSGESASLNSGTYGFYPHHILDLLGVDLDWLAEERLNFLSSNIHSEWMTHLDSILMDLDPEKKEAMIENHTALLAMKEAINAAYMSGNMSHETFKRAVAELLKWHQETYDAILSPEQYEAVFEFKPDEAAGIIEAMVDTAPRYSFILNQEIPVETVLERVQAYKLEEVDGHFKKMILTRNDIADRMQSGEMTSEEGWQAIAQSQQDFIAMCKELLTPEEIDTVFGSLENLESGKTQIEQAAVEDTADIDQLGFKIENPQTSIESVSEKIPKEKIEDLHFLYEKNTFERHVLIEQLDAGEISLEQIQDQLKEVDSAYRESCRKLLTDEEFKMIFDKASDERS